MYACRMATIVFLAACILGCQENNDLSGGNPVVVIGVDGATWSVIDPMIDAGELPNLAGLKARGAWGRLITVGPQVSPVVWTTFATGHFGRQHGILDFVYPYTEGPKKPVESLQRLEPAIWNIASDEGRRVGVVGYFASFPADPVNGVMVTDRAFQRLDESVFPGGALNALDYDHRKLNKSKYRQQLWRRYFPWDYDPSAERVAGSPYEEANRMVENRVDVDIVNSEFVRMVTNHLLEENQFDLFITYFRGPDFANHSLWWYYDDSDYEEKPDPFTQDLLRNVVPESYRFIDEVIGDILDRVPENTNILIVSDHGGGSATGDYAIRDKEHKLLTGNHRPDGVFLAAGPDIKPGNVEGLTIMEIFPMLAALQDLPISDELPGKLDYRPIDDDFVNQHPLRTVSSYPRREARKRSGSVTASAQAETVKSLQGLGYVGQGFELGERGSDDLAGFWDADPKLVMFQLTGELVYWILQEDVETALQVLALAKERRPDVAKHLRQRARVEFRLIAERFPPASLPEKTLAEFLRRSI